jgi:hypothetical protein
MSSIWRWMMLGAVLGGLAGAAAVVGLILLLGITDQVLAVLLGMVFGAVGAQLGLLLAGLWADGRSDADGRVRWRGRAR